MQVEIKVPAMGESISEATIGTLLKAEGSFVQADEELIELETDKVNQVLYAPQAGVVSWSVSPHDVVKIGQAIGKIDTEKKQGTKEAKAPAPKKEPKAAAPKMASQIEMTLLEVAAPQQASTKGGTRATKDVFLNDLTSAPSQPREAATPAPRAPAPAGARPETRKKMSKIRKVIATRLVDVMQQTAMLTSFNEVDMTNVNNLRETYKEAFMKQYNVRLGYMPFFVKAAVSAMKAFPEINSYIDGDDIVYRDYFDVGIAVGTDRGLFVPVVRGCDALSFADIERSIESYAKKAREGGLIPADLQGGGFTITNGGTYGSLLSTPIINPPQCAILGMHKIMKRPVVVNDQIVIRSMMYLALSYDHRIVDGKEAVSFLVHVKNVLEDPSRLVIGI